MENNIKEERLQELEKNILITKNSRMKAEDRLKFYYLWLNKGVALSSIIIVIINVIILVFFFYLLLKLISSLLIRSRNFKIR